MDERGSGGATSCYTTLKSKARQQAPPGSPSSFIGRGGGKHQQSQVGSLRLGIMDGHLRLLESRQAWVGGGENRAQAAPSSTSIALPEGFGLDTNVLERPPPLPPATMRTPGHRGSTACAATPSNDLGQGESHRDGRFRMIWHGEPIWQQGG